MAQQGKIVVFCSTGNIGEALVRSLLDKGHQVTCVDRNKDKISNLFGDRVQFHQWNIDSPQSVEAALNGAERVFLQTPSTNEQPKIESQIIQIAKKNQIKQLVLISMYGASFSEPTNSPFRWHAWSEHALVESGLDFVILRPNYFFQNFITWAKDSIQKEKKFYGCTGESKISMIDARDVAAVAALILTSPIDLHNRNTYSLTGPTAYSFSDISKSFSEQGQTGVEYVDQDEHTYFLRLTSQLSAIENKPFSKALTTLNYSQRLKTGFNSAVTGDYQIITGNKPRTFNDFFRDYSQNIFEQQQQQQ